MNLKNKIVLVTMGIFVICLFFAICLTILLQAKVFATRTYNNWVEPISPTIEASPSAEPTIEITTVPTITSIPPPGNVPENPNDGLSDGRASCPDCTKSPTIPSGPPETGRI